MKKPISYHIRPICVPPRSTFCTGLKCGRGCISEIMVIIRKDVKFKSGQNLHIPNILMIIGYKIFN